MQIAILNGNPDTQARALEDYVEQLTTMLTAQGHQVTMCTLREMDIKYCTGCFGCWVKTPGQCVVKDDSHQVCRTVINSDFTLWAAPLNMGFPSALFKKTLDKSIPLIHPYFVVENNEAHHRSRYDHYPLLGLLLHKEPDTDEDDVRIVNDILSRTALNMKSRLTFAHTTDQAVEETARAILESDTLPGVAFIKDPAPIAGVRIPPPTHLTVFNGSPRGTKGNTPLMLEQLVAGFQASGERTAETFNLVRLNDRDAHRQAWGEAEAVLLGFPLYTDAMPGIVKAFIESLAPFRGRANNPALAFMVQSGFPESAHSRHVERYLEKLAARLGSPYLGTVIKGGCEGVHLMPENMNRKLFGKLFEIGKTLGETGHLDIAQLRDLAKPERYSAFMVPLFKLFVKLPMSGMYWNNQLKENGVYDQRFAQPFVE